MADVANLITETNSLISGSNASGDKNANFIPLLKDKIQQLEDSKTTNPLGIKKVQKVIDDANLTIVNIQKNQKPLKPKLAPTDKNGNEVSKPDVPLDAPGNKIQSEQPTTPGTAAGSVDGTLLDKMNNSLSHVCDFSLEVQKNNALRVFLVAQATNIRDAVRAVMRTLGLSDATGQYQWAYSALKSITRTLKWLQQNVIQPIQLFEKYVVQYIQKIQEIIAWILSLPAKAIALLKDCLTRLYKLLANVMTAVASDLAADAGAGSGEKGFSDVVAAAKEAAGVALQTANQAASAAAGAMALATVASSVPQLVAPLKKGI